jgi:putative endonuclease
VRRAPHEPVTTPPIRQVRGRHAHADGLAAEQAACAALAAEGWTILARRARTPAGEIDIVAESDGLLAFIEVKRRASLAGAALALWPRPRARLLGPPAKLLASNPGWGRAGMRFDVILVDTAGRLRRIADAFRDEG